MRISSGLHPSCYSCLRLMEEEDLPEVLAIERASYEFPWNEGIFRDCLKSSYHCLVVIQKRSIVGYGILILAAEEGHILNICIAHSARSNGFARSLLEDLLATGARKGVQEMFLEVRPSNLYAISLYESAGFNEVGRRPNYYNAGSGREDALIYVKSL